jgi:hypothetical protein
MENNKTFLETQTPDTGDFRAGARMDDDTFARM